MVKKIICIISCIILLISLISSSYMIFAENTSDIANIYEISLNEKEWMEAYQEGWNYPISPDMEEWKALSYKQALAVCNMPQNLLETISTQELVQLALKYPFLVDMYLYDSTEKGLESLCLKSNIINELYNRDDAGTYLLELYEKNECVKNDFIEKEWLKNSFKIEAVQISLDELELTKVQTILREDTVNNSCNTLQPGIQLAMIEPGEFQPTTSEPREHLETDNGALYVRGKYILYGKEPLCFWYHSGDYTDIEKHQVELEVYLAHPNWTYRAEATKKYNCHSYTWISNNTSNVYWLCEVNKYTEATNYFQKITENNQVPSEAYYIVLYKNDEIVHSLRSIGETGTSGDYKQRTLCISKAGSSGVYETTLQEMYDVYQATRYEVYKKIN